MSTQDEYEMVHTEEANGMRKLSKMRYAKPSKLKESWIEQNKQLLTNNLREISQVNFEIVDFMFDFLASKFSNSVFTGGRL